MATTDDLVLQRRDRRAKTDLTSSTFRSSPPTVATDALAPLPELRRKEANKDRRLNTFSSFGEVKRYRDEVAISPEVLSQMHQMHEELDAKRRKEKDQPLCYACSVEPLVVSAETFRESWGVDGSWLVTARVPQAKELPHQIRGFDSYPLGSSKAVLETWGVAAINAKGCKGQRDEDIGQDNFSISRLSNGWEVVCVMDGHGPNGHWPSTRGCQSLPVILQSDSCKRMLKHKQVEAALRHAFSNTETDLVQRAEIEGIDLHACGCTALCFLRNPEEHPNKVWVATVGDSRCTLVSSNSSILQETEDHKPNTPKEQERLEKMGCEVRVQHHSNGFIECRLFIKGQDFPGLCMSRTLGDLVVKGSGVTWEPVIVEWHTPPGSILLGASDGLWEFITTEEVGSALQQLLQAGKPLKSVMSELLHAARQLWEENEGPFYCDDITMVLFPSDLAPAPKCEVVNALKTGPKETCPGVKGGCTVM